MTGLNQTYCINYLISQNLIESHSGKHPANLLEILSMNTQNQNPEIVPGTAQLTISVGADLPSDTAKIETFIKENLKPAGSDKFEITHENNHD